MYNKILVPLDGDELAECVLNHLRTIVIGNETSEVILLTVIEPSERVSPMISWGGAISAEQEATQSAKDRTIARNYITDVANRLRKEGINSHPVLKQGKAAEEILDYTADNQIDLIIMSTHGRSGPSRWAFGSVADRVIRYSTIPILIVPPKGCRINH